MSVVATLLGWLILAPLLLATAIFVIEAGLGLPRRARRPLPDGPMPDTVVLIPAHDEAKGIARVLGAIGAALPENARLLVVADNCSDDTAARARAAGAEVVERHDPARRGKGFALAFGREHLRAAPPACVIVIDADCVPEGDTIARLARAAIADNAPIQSAYLIAPKQAASPMVQISGFAFLVKNLVRQAGLRQIGAPAVLTGSGMAFPWALFADVPLASDNIVEDLALGIDLARAGHPPCFEAGAFIWSEPSSGGGTLTQRTRWENGFLATARGHALPLIGEGLATRRWGLLWLGLHLLVPPLALLVMLDLVAAGALALLALAGGNAVPFAIALGLLVVVCIVVGLAWGLHGRAQIGAATLLRVPLYLLWKIPIYLRLVRGGETRWVRTERDGE
jgi:cellulose synthase/poly-beta-1,6-N-acetylglucosamine synthase-like glycosyltransferase